MDQFTERKVPKRKDRWSMMAILYVAFFALPVLSLFYPVFGDIFFEVMIWVYMVFIFGLFIAISYYQWWAWHNRWQDIAERSGLFYERYKPKQVFAFEWPRIRGVTRGFGIQVERFTRGSGRNKKIYTSINLTLKRSITEAMTISKASWLSGAKRAFYGSDRELQFVQLGDDEFDKKLEVKSVSEQFARNTLTSYSLKQGLLEIQSQAPGMHLSVGGNALYYHERTNIMDADYMLAVIKTLTEFAEYVERYGY